MKIKKHGSYYQKEEVIKAERFECKKCGCVFTAKDDEYYTDWGTSSTSYTGSLTYTWTSTITDWLVCSCPECHKIVKKSRKRELTTTPYTTTTPFTVTCNNSLSGTSSNDGSATTHTSTVNAEWTSEDALDDALTLKG